ncbi:hypothetical protein RI367_006490 [Sorochytrium milnesiophthora]
MDVPSVLARRPSLSADVRGISLWWRSYDFHDEYNRGDNDHVLQALAELFSSARVGDMGDWTGTRVRDMLATLTHTIWYREEEKERASTRDAKDRAMQSALVRVLEYTELLWNSQEQDAADSRYHIKSPDNDDELPDQVDAIASLLACAAHAPAPAVTFSEDPAPLNQPDQLPVAKVEQSASTSLVTTMLETVEKARLAYSTAPAQIFARVGRLSEATKGALAPLISHCVTLSSSYSVQSVPSVGYTDYGDYYSSFAGKCQLQSETGDVVAFLSVSFSCEKKCHGYSDQNESLTCTLGANTGLKFNLRDGSSLDQVAHQLGVSCVPTDELLEVLFACAIGPNVPYEWAHSQFFDNEAGDDEE